MPPKIRPNMPFIVASDDYLNEVASLKRESTYRHFKLYARKLNLDFGHMKIQDITRKDIQKFIVRESAQGGVGRIRQFLIVFKGIMENADEDWEMPRVILPKAKRPKREYHTFEEVRQLLKYCDGWQRALIMLLAETGCRIGEALALQTEDLGNHTISITKTLYENMLQDAPKTESSIRTVCISERLSYELLLLCSGPKEFLFQTPRGKSWSQMSLKNALLEFYQAARVPYKGFHAFRRGNVTHLINDLMMPERIVGMRIGHLSATMTLGTYCQVTAGIDRIWMPKIEKLLYEGEL